MNEGDLSLMASEMAVWADTAPSGEERKPSSRPVDLVHLSRYTLGERALEREVLELFCTQSLVYLERLRAAKSDQDWKDAAHSLKGSASAIGAWRTAEAAQRAEAMSGETLIAGARPPAPRHRVVAARGRDLYRRAAQGSLSARTPRSSAAKALESHFQLAYRAGPRAGRPFSRLHLSGASRSPPGPRDRTTEARQCHGHDHLYPERRD